MAYKVNYNVGIGYSGCTSLCVERPDDVEWVEETDVVVVGFGCAGACAAIEARERGAKVLVIDRFGGGGATALSGGVYYGGATRFQREAGVDDTPEDMFEYLRMEVGDAVTEETLRRFCKESSANLEWLIAHGARFGSSLASDEEAYMAPGRSLYYSGNERVPSYAARARPAPRGHIAVGKFGGSKGVVLFEALRVATLKSGARLRQHSPATRIVTDSQGRILGLEVADVSANAVALWRHQLYNRLFRLGKGILYGPPAGVLLNAMARIESAAPRVLLRARRGIVLASGGFMHNRDMVARHLPRHVHAIPLGSPGCMGDGIQLGQAMGAGTSRLDVAEISRGLQIPSPFLNGVLVNAEGARFIAEDAYGASIGHEILNGQGGNAWLILDARTFWRAMRLVMPWRRMVLRYRLRALSPLLFARRRARDLNGLAQTCGIDPEGLERTINLYNQVASSGKEDPLGKLRSKVTPMEVTGPFYAIDCGTGSRGFPPLSFTLGGLVIDEHSGQVLRQDGTPIQGLYAAGRVAIGIPSNFYVSGLSISDCVFSGRRAGAAVTLGADLVQGSSKMSRRTAA